MKKLFTPRLIPALLLLATALAATADAGQDSAEELEKFEYQSMLEEAERARQEAEVAHQRALKAAEMARETARMNAEMARESARMRADMARGETEQRRQASEQLARERALQDEELARAREELSKAHRELRKATREVARAHRDLARTDNVRVVERYVNLGDRAVIGVVLGKESDEGVNIIGVSPDGPAERAGLEQGDILVSIDGVELGGDREARKSVFEVMSNVSDGEELAVEVIRDGKSLEFTVTAELREPRSWQSVIRIPDMEVIASELDDASVIVENIEIPDFDEEALAERMKELTERLEANKYRYSLGDREHWEHHEFDFDEFSDFGKHALSEANIWFGLPRAHGLELTAINEGLGAYFKTDRGVLVIRAKEGNAYQLTSGDVILSIDSTAVNSPSDMMRALRDMEPGSEIDIEIKRDRRDRTLAVIVPENRLGLR